MKKTGFNHPFAAWLRIQVERVVYISYFTFSLLPSNSSFHLLFLLCLTLAKILAAWQFQSLAPCRNCWPWTMTPSLLLRCLFFAHRQKKLKKKSQSWKNTERRKCVAHRMKGGGEGVSSGRGWEEVKDQSRPGGNKKWTEKRTVGGNIRRK